MSVVYLILYAHALHSMVIITLPCIVLSFVSFLNLFLLCSYFLFLVGLWFLALLVPSVSVFFFFFCLSLIKSSDFLCPLTIVSKRGRNLRIECLSSEGVIDLGGIIDLGGELHVKGKKVFVVTNLGGELV